MTGQSFEGRDSDGQVVSSDGSWFQTADQSSDGWASEYNGSTHETWHYDPENPGHIVYQEADGTFHDLYRADDGSITDGAGNPRDAHGNYLDTNGRIVGDASHPPANAKQEPEETANDSDGGNGSDSGEGSGNDQETSDEAKKEEKKNDDDTDSGDTGETAEEGGSGEDAGEDTGEDTDEDAASTPGPSGEGTGVAGGDDLDLPEFDEIDAAEDFWSDPTKAFVGQPGEGETVPTGGDFVPTIEVEEPEITLPGYLDADPGIIDPLDLLGQPGAEQHEDLSSISLGEHLAQEDWVINPNPNHQMTDATASQAFDTPMSPGLTAAGGGDEEEDIQLSPGLTAAGGGDEEEDIQLSPGLTAAGGGDEEEDIQLSPGLTAAGGGDEEEDIQLSPGLTAAGGGDEEEDIQLSPGLTAAGGGDEEQDIQLSPGLTAFESVDDASQPTVTTIASAEPEEEEVQASPAVATFDSIDDAVQPAVFAESALGSSTELFDSALVLDADADIFGDDLDLGAFDQIDD